MHNGLPYTSPNAISQQVKLYTRSGKRRPLNSEYYLNKLKIHFFCQALDTEHHGELHYPKVTTFKVLDEFLDE